MIKELKGRIDELCENFNKKRETIKKNKPGMKNTLHKISSRLVKAEDGISNLEDKVEENTTSEKQKEKRIKK